MKNSGWIPAFAGMTMEKLSKRELSSFPRKRESSIVAAVALLVSMSAGAQNIGNDDTRNLDLLIAVKTGETSNALVLLDGASDVNQPEADGMTALHYGVLNNDVAIVTALLGA